MITVVLHPTVGEPMVRTKSHIVTAEQYARGMISSILPRAELFENGVLVKKVRYVASI